MTSVGNAPVGSPVKLLRICTYNVQSARESRLEAAARSLELLNVDLAVITEAKLQGFHTLRTFGYDVTSSHASSKFKGGVALLIRSKHNGWHVESTRQHGPNVLSCVLVAGNRRWLVIGATFPQMSIVG